jgi:UPF0755 protein
MPMSQLGLTMAGESSGGRRTDRKKRRQRKRRGGLAVIISFVVVLGLVGGLGYYGVAKGRAWMDARFGSGPDYAGPGTGQVVVEVQDGATVGEIGRALHKQDVVQSSRAFVDAAAGEPKSQSIQPGFYQLRKQMKASEALALILDPKARVGAVSIPEGQRASQIAALVAQRGGIPATQLQAKVKNPAGLGLPAFAGNKVEGFLFPARYDVEKSMTAQQALAQMVQRFNQETAGMEIEARARELGVTPYEALIVASLVQAEARRHEDFGKVARVVYNRLGSKFEYERKLQFDSTINYAKNTSNLRLSLKEINALKSPYNTYTRAGLPPTPIGNPGRDAIEAALNPAPGNWRYFVTVDTRTGETRFTDDYQQFLRWKAEFKRHLNSLGGR